MHFDGRWLPDTVSVWTLLPAAFGLSALWGHLETWRLRVVRTKFTSPLIPKALDGYRIVLLGGLFLRRLGWWTQRIQGAIQELEPDLLLLAGNTKPARSVENAMVHGLLAKFLEPLSVPDGVIAVRGYHDRPRFWESLPGRSSIRVLSNSHCMIERGGGKLVFMGIQTAHASHLDRGINNLRETVEGPPSEGFRILVGQSGDLLRVAQGQPIHLILAVDNLHAQVRIPGLGVIRRDSKCPLSWERGWIEEGNLSMYLSPGVGTRRLPLRFFLRPEITCVVLRSGRHDTLSMVQTAGTGAGV